MLLQGKLCAVRPWRVEDAQSLASEANNRKIWRNVRDAFPHPYTLDDARAWLEASAAAGEASTNFAIEVGGRAVGGIGYRPLDDVHRRSADFGYWLGESFWGRRIATEAARMFAEYIFESTNLVRLEARVYAWNPASARVLEKAGFEFEGRRVKGCFKDGEFVDELIYARVKA